MDATRLNGRNIVDATEPYQLTLKRVDAENAAPLDPDRCVIANGAKRQTEIIEAHIKRTMAYVRFRKTPDEWTRFDLSKDDRDIVAEYDEGGIRPGLVNGRSVRLLPPSKPLGVRRGEKPGTDVRPPKPRPVPVYRHSVSGELVV